MYQSRYTVSEGYTETVGVSGTGHLLGSLVYEPTMSLQFNHIFKDLLDLKTRIGPVHDHYYVNVRP